MSINYHAYQNREVPFSNHEALAEQWYGLFRGFRPERVGRILGLTWDKDYLYIHYLGEEYRLVLETGHLEKCRQAVWEEGLFFNEAMALYHVLHFVKDVPLVSGKWVLSDSLSPVAGGRIPQKDPLFAPFAARFSGKLQELEERCRGAGGRKVDGGDLGFEFSVFPFMSFRLIFWDAEEDFPAQVQVLVDSCVTDYLHTETVGCIISDLLEKIEK